MRLIFPAFLVLLTATPVLAQDCPPIRFAPGTSSAVVEGVIPIEGHGCHSIDVAIGQNMQVEITGSAPDIAVTIVDEKDNQSSWSFVTRQRRYELLPHKTFPAAREETYRMAVRVD